jgi:hypothetical protein
MRLLAGKPNPLLASAARTRSRASLTSMSASPTTVNDGSPLVRCTYTVTGAAARPSRAREWTVARGMAAARSIVGGAGAPHRRRRGSLRPDFHRIAPGWCECDHRMTKVGANASVPGARIPDLCNGSEV